MLEAECERAGVTIFLNTKIQNVERAPEFIARAPNAEFKAPALVVATGGLSIPKIGATSFGYDLARQFGLAIREPWPGLVPLTLSKEDCDRYCDLLEFRRSHCVVQRSAVPREDVDHTPRPERPSNPADFLLLETIGPILIDLAPASEITAAFRDPKTPRNLNTPNRIAKFLPHRLADRWLEAHAPTSWTNAALADFEKQTHAWAITPAGTEGYEKAEVTAGGIDTNDLSAKTMEARRSPACSSSAK